MTVHIKEVRTTKDLWTKLKSMFDDSGFTIQSVAYIDIDALVTLWNRM